MVWAAYEGLVWFAVLLPQRVMFVVCAIARNWLENHARAPADCEEQGYKILVIVNAQLGMKDMEGFCDNPSTPFPKITANTGSH